LVYGDESGSLSSGTDGSLSPGITGSLSSGNGGSLYTVFTSRIRFLTLLLLAMNMTTITPVESSVTPFTLPGTHLVDLCLQICEIGITLHTSAKSCVWNTNVHFA